MCASSGPANTHCARARWVPTDTQLHQRRSRNHRVICVGTAGPLAGGSLANSAMRCCADTPHLPPVSTARGTNAASPDAATSAYFRRFPPLRRRCCSSLSGATGWCPLPGEGADDCNVGKKRKTPLHRQTCGYDVHAPLVARHPDRGVGQHPLPLHSPPRIPKHCHTSLMESCRRLIRAEGHGRT